MTDRDTIAMFALQGLLAAERDGCSYIGDISGTEPCHTREEHLAIYAYKLADAMIAKSKADNVLGYEQEEASK